MHCLVALQFSEPRYVDFILDRPLVKPYVEARDVRRSRSEPLGVAREVDSQVVSSWGHRWARRVLGETGAVAGVRPLRPQVPDWLAGSGQ